MIDIHTHILPMVDDGASSFDEALDMAVMAAECGVQALVATPHSNHDVGFVNFESEHLRARFEKLCTRAPDFSAMLLNIASEYASVVYLWLALYFTTTPPPRVAQFCLSVSSG